MVCDSIAHRWKPLARILQRERGLYHIAVAQGGSFDPQGRVSLALPTSVTQNCSGSNAARSEGSNAQQDEGIRLHSETQVAVITLSRSIKLG
jgi:hypothetical protein